MIAKDTLLVFNPDHDLALANGDCHYLPPNSAVQFADDVAALPSWLFGCGYVRIPAFTNSQSMRSLFEILDNQAQLVLPSDVPNLSVTQVQPWGWDNVVRNKLRNDGVRESLLPDDTFLQNVRRFSHRAFAAAAADFLKNKSDFAASFPQTAVALSDMIDIEQFMTDNKDVFFKLPWSGSGKGLKRGIDALTDNLRGWLRNSLLKYGCVMGEKRLNVVQDFAMEFECFDHVNFCGYSLFNTQNGAYQGNILISNEQIRQKLACWIPLCELDEVQSLLQQFLTQQLLPHYQGFVGVDMFIFERNGNFSINPIVEINLRMTMGLLAVQLTKQFLADNVSGTMNVRFEFENGALLHEHERLMRQFPLVVQNHRVMSGYFALCPVSAQTHYAVQVFVEP